MACMYIAAVIGIVSGRGVSIHQHIRVVETSSIRVSQCYISH